jgi:hypothetical protein
MGFNINYNAGGTIDEVKKVNLPASLFPSGNTPKTKGFRMDIPALPGVVEIVYSVPFEINLIDASMACSGYHDLDYWEIEIDGIKICETMYTKELPENISQGNSAKIAYTIPADTKIKMQFNNQSATSKKAWFTLRYLYKKEDL